MAEEQLTIGQLAERAGFSVRMVHYYLKAGLLPEPQRTAAGYRLFPPDAVARLRTIRALQALGFLSPQIVLLLRAQALSSPERLAAVREVLVAHQSAIAIKARSYAAVEAKLAGTSPEAILALLTAAD